MDMIDAISAIRKIHTLFAENISKLRI
jgi:hypothetical protein